MVKPRPFGYGAFERTVQQLEELRELESALGAVDLRSVPWTARPHHRAARAAVRRAVEKLEALARAELD